MLLRSTAASISRSASGFVRPTAAVPASAPAPDPGRFRPPSPALAVLAYASASIDSHRGLLSYSRVSCSALRPALAATMASADFWRSFPAPLDAGSTQADRQISPGIAHSPSRLCLSDLRHGVPCKNWALRLLARLPHRAASIRFLFVRPALCLQLPPDSASRRTPLPFS